MEDCITVRLMVLYECGDACFSGALRALVGEGGRMKLGALSVCVVTKLVDCLGGRAQQLGAPAFKNRGFDSRPSIHVILLAG